MSEFKSILLEVDPRLEEQPAVERVRQLLKGNGADVNVMLCECMDSPRSGLGPVADLENAQAKYVEKLRTWLAEQAGRLDGGNVRTDLVWHAPRFEAILEQAAKVKADLIIRSAHYHSKLERLIISATDWELIRRAPQTVWLAKKSPEAGSAGLNVLAAVDPVHAEEKKVGLDQRVLRVARDIASRGNGSLHLFHAWEPGLAMAPAVASSPHVPMPVVRIDADTIERLRRQREDMLAELAGEFGVERRNVHLGEGAVTDVLDELVKEHAIDVVVAGGISRGRLERLIIGNTAEAILESVDCDVVVVKPESDGSG